MTSNTNGLMKSAPIAVFDSGLGGLTVLRELLPLLARESFIYLADNANAPYGRNSAETVRQDTLNNVDFFLSQGVKMIIFACNTSSAIALDDAKMRAAGVPVLGVIDAGIEATLSVVNNDADGPKIAVLATDATVASDVFFREIPDFYELQGYRKPEVKQRACQDFVRIVEDGCWDDAVAYERAEEYLADLRQDRPDIALLACTHFPLLKSAIQKALPDSILVDCSQALALNVKKQLETFDLLNDTDQVPELKFFQTKEDPDMKVHIERILDIDIDHVQHVSIQRSKSNNSLKEYLSKI